MIDGRVGAAIEYSGDVPKVLAIARGLLIEKLIQLAEENNITIYKEPDLARMLAVLPVGSEIPESLFKAVTQVLAYCYKINEKFKSKVDSLGIL
jgi:flagellar biosynthesis protein